MPSYRGERAESGRFIVFGLVTLSERDACLTPNRRVRLFATFTNVYRWRDGREPRLGPLLDSLKAPPPGDDHGQLRQLQAETAKLSTENAGRVEFTL